MLVLIDLIVITIGRKIKFKLISRRKYFILDSAACGNIEAQDVLNAAEAMEGRERPVALKLIKI
jgi:hypothetical protein